MRVSSEYNVSWFGIPALCHELMADPIVSVNVFQSVFLYKRITNLKMPDIFHRTGRNQMIINQNHPVRIPQLCKSHLLKLFCNKRDKNIMDHHAVHIDCHDLSRGDCRGPCISFNNLFDNCISHAISPHFFFSLLPPVLRLL